jgi:phosphoglycerol transferase MdoB-like AlkP superfamily enzyme
MVSLWGKLIYFSISLRYLWWAPEESFGQWVSDNSNIFTATLAVLMLLLAPLALLPRSWRFLFLILLNLLISSLVVADLVYVHFYGDVPSISNLVSITMLTSVASSILELLKPEHAIWYLDIFIGALILPFYLRASRRLPRLKRRQAIFLCAGMLSAAVLLSIPTLHLTLSDKSGVFAYTNLQREVCAKIGILPYHVSDLVTHLRSRRRDVAEPELQRVRQFLDEKQKQQSSSELFAVARGRNVILISAESLQAFPIGLEVEGQPITPRLSAFAKESLYFTNFYDQTHLGTTSDAEFMSLQSLHPLAVGVVSSGYTSNRYRALPSILSQNGYSTISACGASGDFWNMKLMHARFGFKQSFFEEAFEIRERVGTWLADKEFFTQSLPILKEEEEPFMAFFLSSSNHHPYELPEGYRRLNLGEMEGTLLGNYLHSVHYFDGAFGEFLDHLREAGLLEKSVVVLYGDHQGFVNWGELARLLDIPEQSQYYQLLLRKKVPLIIRLPHGHGAGARSVAGGHLDIAPTLLSLVGVAGESVMMGRDLTLNDDSLVVFRDGSFIDGAYYFINRFGPTSYSTCYELETGQRVEAGMLESKRGEALKRLEISDIIIRGDLIPALSAEGSRPLHSKRQVDE